MASHILYIQHNHKVFDGNPKFPSSKKYRLSVIVCCDADGQANVYCPLGI